MGNRNERCGNTFNSTGNITFSSAPGSGTKSTVANATGKKLRIFYHKQEIKLEDVLVDSGTTKKRFKPNPEISFIDLPVNYHLEAASLDEGYASIFVTAEEDSEVYVKTISLNYRVPYGACYIVTAKNEVKFRKSDGGVWVDEDGHDHSTK